MNKIIQIIMMGICMLGMGSSVQAAQSLDDTLKKCLNTEPDGGFSWTQGHDYCNSLQNRCALYGLVSKRWDGLDYQIKGSGKEVPGLDRKGIVTSVRIACDTRSANPTLTRTEVYESVSTGTLYNTIRTRTEVHHWEDAKDQHGAYNLKDYNLLPHVTTTTGPALTTFGKCCVAATVAGVVFVWKYKEKIKNLVSGAKKVTVL